jgi:anti-sigma factor RsiW
MVELVTDYLDGALSRADRARFEQHLAGCPHCVEYVNQIRTVVLLTGRLDPESVPPAMEADLLRLFRRWRSGAEPAN